MRAASTPLRRREDPFQHEGSNQQPKRYGELRAPRQSELAQDVAQVALEGA
jgi:hypothetical protein